VFESYAQNGEDVVLWRVLQNVENGTYVDVGAADPDDDGLREAFVTVSGLAIVKAVRERVDREADELAEKWFAEHRVAI
jgi:hypothetical protein